MDRDRKLDGNAVAGVLDEVFMTEMTMAMGTCAGCRSVAPLAEVDVYMDAPGAVLRCRACGQVLMTVVRARDRVWLGLQGLRVLELSMGAG